MPQSTKAACSRNQIRPPAIAGRDRISDFGLVVPQSAIRNPPFDSAHGPEPAEGQFASSRQGATTTPTSTHRAKKSPKKSLFHIAAAFSLLFAGAAVRAQTTPRTDAAVRPGLDEAHAIVRLIREQATPEKVKGTALKRPKRLDQPWDLPLIVSLYHNGPTGFHHAGTRSTLAASAKQAGNKLLAFAAKLRHGRRVLNEGLIQIDIVVRRKPMGEKHRYLLMEGLSAGLDGLICTSKGRTVHLTPLTLLRHWRTADVIKAAYIAQELRAPAAKLQAERINTACFVEASPGGTVLPVFRGNVLLPQPTYPVPLIESALHGGAWLVRTQQENGSFLPSYFPAPEKADPKYQYSLVDHLRATGALMRLHELTKDNLFADRARRALRFAGNWVREERRDALAYLESGKDEIMATAMFLTTLCYEASREDAPTASALMRYLGEYLCLMTTPDGRLYESLANAREGRPPYVVAGEPYAETLLALCLLEHISPTDRVRNAAARIAKYIIRFTRDAPSAGPRTIEALAEYCKLAEKSEKKRYGEAVIVLGKLLTHEQRLGRKARAPDWVGGFAAPNLPPDTYTTAAATCGLAIAYDVGQQMGRPVGQFSDPVRRATPFLMTMQFRKENTFYLRHPEVILGGFRTAVDDLSLRLTPSAEAIRALIFATSITERTLPPKD